ncbi:HPF/RaiA family ribosome-associated protein [Paradevosia shaoguanensis]|uniref:HPF/RaiA family ribosome-associated protein n=1 Tax=Paradevosia shaoguanensis TaxID=1335043 RepID=UPI003C767865
MDAPIEVSFRHFEPSDRIRAKVEELTGQLDKFDREIISGRVIIDGKNKIGHKSVVSIQVELSYPGGLAVGKRSGEFPSPTGQQTFDTALTDAFHTAAAQVAHHFQKRSPQDVKQLAHQPEHGRIARLDTTVRNGFIEMHDGATLFFSEAVLKGRFDTLAEGDEVLAIPSDEEGPYGPQASAVKPIGPLA